MKRLQSLLYGLAAAALLPIAMPGRADQLPQALQAMGIPEMTLAGITMSRTTLEDVIAAHGPPSQVQQPPHNPAYSSYEWKFQGLILQIGVQRVTKQCRTIGSVYVEGSSGGGIGITGAGLHLGDDIEALKRIYGDRFKITDVSRLHAKGLNTGTPGDRQIFLQWAAGGSMLIGLDRAGRIIAMRLDPPNAGGTCHPGSQYTGRFMPEEPWSGLFTQSPGLPVAKPGPDFFTTLSIGNFSIDLLKDKVETVQRRLGGTIRNDQLCAYVTDPSQPSVVWFATDGYHTGMSEFLWTKAKASELTDPACARLAQDQQIHLAQGLRLYELGTDALDSLGPPSVQYSDDALYVRFQPRVEDLPLIEDALVVHADFHSIMPAGFLPRTTEVSVIDIRLASPQ